MIVDYLCRVCGSPGLLSYTVYDRDKPTACRHETKALGSHVRVTFAEPDSELGMDEPLGPVLHSTTVQSCDVVAAHGDGCPCSWVACSCGFREEYPTEPAARFFARSHESFGTVVIPGEYDSDDLDRLVAERDRR